MSCIGILANRFVPYYFFNVRVSAKSRLNFHVEPPFMRFSDQLKSTSSPQKEKSFP